MMIARALLAMLAASLALAESSANAATSMAFIGCPEFRQASVGCWTIEHEGVTYFVGNPANNMAPQLRHKLLVEGTVDASAPKICGGIQFKPLNVSVMREVSPECETTLPALPGMEPPGNFMSEQTLTFIQAGTPPVKKPYLARPLTVAFDFDSSFIFLPKLLQVESVIKLALAADAKQIILSPSFGSTLLSDGTTMVENPKIMDARVEVIREAFVNFGYPAKRIKVSSFPAVAARGPAARSLVIQVRL